LSKVLLSLARTAGDPLHPLPWTVRQPRPVLSSGTLESGGNGWRGNAVLRHLRGAGQALGHRTVFGSGLGQPLACPAAPRPGPVPTVVLLGRPRRERGSDSRPAALPRDRPLCRTSPVAVRLDRPPSSDIPRDALRRAGVGWTAGAPVARRAAEGRVSGLPMAGASRSAAGLARDMVRPATADRTYLGRPTRQKSLAI